VKLKVSHACVEQRTPAVESVAIAKEIPWLSVPVLPLHAANNLLNTLETNVVEYSAHRFSSCEAARKSNPSPVPQGYVEIRKLGHVAGNDNV